MIRTAISVSFFFRCRSQQFSTSVLICTAITGSDRRCHSIDLLGVFQWSITKTNEANSSRSFTWTDHDRESRHRAIRGTKSWTSLEAYACHQQNINWSEETQTQLTVMLFRANQHFNRIEKKKRWRGIALDLFLILNFGNKPKESTRFRSIYWKGHDWRRANPIISSIDIE